jgi:hypothetical protein
MTLRSPLLALGVFALAACADPVAPRQARPNVPDGPNAAVVVNSIDPVTFTLPAGPPCGLTTTVTATGEFHTVIRVQSKSGVETVTFSLSAHGTASGADGSQYVFNYANAQELVNPEVIDIVDHFNLLGQGKTPDLKVYLHGTFQAVPPFAPIGDPVIRGPSFSCDPI